MVILREKELVVGGRRGSLGDGWGGDLEIDGPRVGDGPLRVVVRALERRLCGGQEAELPKGMGVGTRAVGGGGGGGGE